MNGFRKYEHSTYILKDANNNVIAVLEGNLKPELLESYLKKTGNKYNYDQLQRYIKLKTKNIINEVNNYDWEQ